MKRDTIQDPFCGMRLSSEDAVARLEWMGRTYSFCSEFCKVGFQADPERALGRVHAALETRRVRIPIVGLACASDGPAIERGLRSVAGVLDAYVNPIDQAAYLTVRPREFCLDDALGAVQRYGARPIAPPSAQPKR